MFNTQRINVVIPWDSARPHGSKDIELESSKLLPIEVGETDSVCLPYFYRQRN